MPLNKQPNAELFIGDFPMPPSWNQAKTVARYGRQIVNTKAANDFEKECKVWAKKRAPHLQELRLTAKEICAGGYMSVSFWFCFPREKLLTLDGSPKTIDVSNRIKMLEDRLAEVIEVDDKFFQLESCEKLFHSGAQSFVVIRLRSSPILSLKERIEVSGFEKMLSGLLPPGCGLGPH